MSHRLCCLLTASTLILPVVAHADRVVDETFDVDPAVRVSVEAFKGRIEVRTEPGASTVRMLATITPDDGPEDDVEYVDVRSSVSGGSVWIAVDYDHPNLQRRDDGGWFGTSSSTSLPFVDFEIVMPDGGELELESHKSDFDVEAPSGGLEIESHKGAGEIRNVRGDFELDTHKGRFDVEIVELADVRVDTHKGDIELRIHGAQDFAIRGDTHKGDLRFRGRYDVPIRRGDDDERWVNFEVGSGRHLIELETHKGEITVDFE